MDRSEIEAALIAGFHSLQSRPCMTAGRRFVEGHAPQEAMIFNLVEDADLPDLERKALLVWSRCMANGESWSDWCRGMGLPRQTMEERRLRAMRRMVAAQEGAGLDNRTDPRRLEMSRSSQEELT